MGVLGFVALSHRKEIVSRPYDGEGSPGARPGNPRKGFSQSPPANVKEAVLHAGSVSECGEVQREGCAGAGHSQYLQGAVGGAGFTSHRVSGCSWRGLCCPRGELGPSVVTAWDGAQVSVRSMLWFLDVQKYL